MELPYVAPLCPPEPLSKGGHLPRKGGDQSAALLSPIGSVVEGVPAAKLPISPLVGEMSGRTEGGATEHRPQRTTARLAAPEINP